MAFVLYFIFSCVLLTISEASQKCYWSGTAPFCEGDCGGDYRLAWSWHGDGHTCLSGHKVYCCPRTRSSSSVHVTVCDHKDHGGECEIIYNENTECVTLSHNDKVTSVDTHGTCVRLYEHDKCTGYSVAMYPGSPHHNDLTKWKFNDRTSSVGPCLRGDFCPRSKRSNNNNCRFAADVLFVGLIARLARDWGRIEGPVLYYQLGHNGRTERMESIIYPRHLDTGTPTNDNSRDYVHRMGHNWDQAGHVLASRLGGSGTDERNLFPQSGTINMGAFRLYESIVYDVVRRTGRARYSVNLQYATEHDTRPFQIVFRIESGEDDTLVLMDSLPNP